jgi:hypothetical protein
MVTKQVKQEQKDSFNGSAKTVDSRSFEFCKCDVVSIQISVVLKGCIKPIKRIDIFSLRIIFEIIEFPLNRDI